MLILIASSAAFAVTFSILLSTQAVGSNVLGDQSGVIIVSSGSSRTPMTGTLPLSLAGSIGNVSGVSAFSPEVLAPSTISNRPVMVVGVYPQLFAKVESGSLKISSGSYLTDGSNAAIAGDTIANELGLKVGSSVLLVGTLNSAVAQVTIVGTFHTGTASLDDEIVAPTWVGQWLRGFDYQTISIIRLRVDPQSATGVEQAVLNVVGGNSSSSSSFSQGGGSSSSGGASPLGSFYSSLYANTPISAAELARLNIQVNPGTSGDFLARTLGLSQGSVWIIAALVFLSLSVAVIYAFQETVMSSRDELDTLSMIGMSSKRIKSSLVLSGILFSVVAGLAGWALGITLIEIIPGLSALSIVFYVVNPTAFALIALAGTLLVVSVEAGLAGLYSSFQYGRSPSPSSLPSEPAAGDYVEEDQ